MGSTSCRRDSTYRALHFVILLLFSIIAVTSGSSDDNQWLRDCDICSCKWVRSKKMANCENLTFTEIPKKLSKEIQYMDTTNNFIPEIRHSEFIDAGLINLHLIVMKNCTLQELHRDAFKGLTILIELDLSYNDLTVLPSGLFKDTLKLRKLLLNNNKIQHLQANLFKDLIFLSQADFQNNQIKEVEVGTFVNVSSLININFDSNNLTTLRKEIFENITKLVSLTLVANPWNCTCQLMEFSNYVIQKNLYTYPTDCMEPPKLRGKLWKNIKMEDFACRPNIIQPWKQRSQQPQILEAASENVTLTCRIQASPKPNIQWFFKGRPINLRDRRLSIINVLEKNRLDNIEIFSSDLNIIGVRPSDNGAYACVAENAGGRDQAEMSLMVDAVGSGGGVIGESSSSLQLIICIVAVLLVVLLIAVILVLCIFCRRAKHYTKDTSLNEHCLMNSKMDKTQNGSMLEGSVITEMQKSLLTEVNPVEKPPRRTDIEAMDTEDGPEIKKTLLDETPFGSHDEETNSVALSDTTPRSRQTFVDDGYGTNLPPDLLSFPARVPQSPSLQSSMSNIPDNRLYVKSPLSSPVYQHVAANHPNTPGGGNIYGTTPAAFRTLQHPKNRNLTLAGNNRNNSPFLPAPIVYPPVVMKQGYMTIPRKPRVPSWTPSCSTTLSEFQPTNVSNTDSVTTAVEPVYDNLGLRTTAGGNSMLNLNKLGISGQSPAVRYTMKDRPLPATPIANTNGIGNNSRIYEPIQELTNSTMTSDTEPLYGTAKTNYGLTIVPSAVGGTLDKISKIPPRPPPKPKKKMSVTSNGQGSTSQLFEDEGEDGTEV